MQAVTETFKCDDNGNNRHFYGLTGLAVCLFALPVVVGFIGILLPALGYFPALGHTTMTSHPLHQFLATPGLTKAAILSLKTGIFATIFSLIGCFFLSAILVQSRTFRWVRRLIGPLVAVPHSTIALAMLFLLAPSGWLMRLVSPAFTGLERPPVWAFIPHPDGWSLILGLVAKELPFLLLIAVSACATLPVKRLQDIGNSLGYGRMTSWSLLIIPLLYRQLRLPVMTVLIFSLSVVDMALILAPTLPPPLAVLVIHGFEDADLAARLPASVGALMQILLALGGLLIWWCLEKIISLLAGLWRYHGIRAVHVEPLFTFIAMAAIIPMSLGAIGLLAALIWSFAQGWFFPDALPAQISFLHWREIGDLRPLIMASCWLALAASSLANAIIFIWLYIAAPDHRARPYFITALFLPLLVPQVSFLFGLQIFLSWVGLAGKWASLIYSHMIFIMPYSWLVLAPAFAAMDRRHDWVASSLGLGSVQRFFRLYLPLFAFPLCTSIFIGISVSVALYLPTVFVGGGRISTLTVEAVALGASGGRGPAGVAAMLQIIIPLLAFLLIQLWLRYRFGKFKAMRTGQLV